MIILFIIWLLAAPFTIVIAGPVPQEFRRLLSPLYSNASSTASVISATIIRTSTAEIIFSSSSGSSVSAQQSVEADTAVVVEPIDRTVFTETQPAITFYDPKGQPLVTQPEETILSTSYITQPASKHTPSATATPKENPGSSTTIPLETSTTVGSPSAPKSVTPSGTGYQGPMFTYSPEESQKGNTSIASTTQGQSAEPSNAVPPTTSSNLSTKFLQGKNTTATQPLLSTTQTSSETTSIPDSPTSIVTVSNSAAPLNTSTGSAILPPDPSSAVPSTSGLSVVFVTETDYTTLFPSPSTVEATGPPIPTLTRASTPAIQPSESPSTIPAGGSQSNVLSSSTSVGLPSTPLTPPPVVVVTQTQYTTVTPTPPPASGSSLALTSDASSSELSSSTAAQASKTAGMTPPSPTLEPSASSNASLVLPQPTSKGGGFVYPSHQPPPGPTTLSSAPPESSASDSDAAPPAATDQDPGASSKTPGPVSSKTSDTPLIVTPIAPSQIFTVTVTTTTTEKETVTVTVAP